ncbi:recombinase family protein [Corynebacterium sp. A21]|uniref:recombinase family protein n=1 Tax=Corynebacterium sp. A21 TaxID=3457318 RepID=UPI003FD2988D
MRVLGRVRLSRSNEGSAPLEQQRELIEEWAAANGHEVVAWAEDIDVSGSDSPLSTPALGPYFKKPLADDWDILCSWKLDRIARRVTPLHQVFEWVRQNDKTLIGVADGVDLSAPAGRLVAAVIADMAEGELEEVSERVTVSQRKLREVGRWGGGTAAYGWRSVPLVTGGYRLDHDPETYPTLQRIIGELIAGRPTTAIAAMLTAEGVTAPRNHMNGLVGGEWSGTAIRRLLRSKTLLGWATHEDAPVLDSQGEPVLKAPPAVSQEKYDEIQAVLDGRKWAKVSPDRTSPLLGVLECWYCGAQMYLRKTRKRNAGSYYCSEQCRKQLSVNSNHALEIVHELYRKELGAFHVLEKKVTYASDLSAEIQEAKTAYDEIAAFLPSAPTAETRDTLFNQLDVVGKRITALEDQNTGTEEVSWSKTAQTYQGLWESLNNEGRRQLLIRMGVRVRARQYTRGTRHGYGVVESEFIMPTDLRDRLVD